MDIPYIPIIKWQQYEKKALENVDTSLRNRLLPCIEVRDSSQHTNLIKTLVSVWPQKALIDYSNPKGKLTPTRESELISFIDFAIENKLPIIPVFNQNYLHSINTAFLDKLKKIPYVVIRLRLDKLLVETNDVVNTHKTIDILNKANIQHSLIIDLGVSPNKWINTDLDNFLLSIKPLENLQSLWIHLISGSYPSSLASVKTGVANFDRRDWAFWSDIKNHSEANNFGYGDYGILSPEWTEETLNLRSNRLAIRYTREHDWLILRADGKKTDDSIAISSLLVNVYGADFKGRGYSFGDDLLSDRADPSIPVRKKKCGHYHITEGWSHHIAYVLKEQL